MSAPVMTGDGSPDVDVRFIMRHLRRLAEKSPLVYAPNPGNAGDALILCATLQAFARHHVPFRFYRRDESLDGKILVYGGGGNLVRYYDDAARFIERYLTEVRHLVILPHTVDSHELLLGQFGKNVDLFCRDPVSYEYALHAAPAANVFLAHDLALEFATTEIDSFGYSQRATLPLRQAIKHRLRRMVLLKSRFAAVLRWRPNGKNKGLLRAYRADAEGTGKGALNGNIDLSALLRPGRIEPAEAIVSVRAMGRLIDRYDVIETDRLHVMIMAALLNKTVRFHGGRYYKNEAVYRHSIKDRFPSVRFVRTQGDL